MKSTPIRAAGLLLTLLLSSMGQAAEAETIDWRKVLEPSCWPKEAVEGADGVTFFTVTCRTKNQGSLWRLDKGAKTPEKVVDVPSSAWHLRAMGEALYFGATDMKHGFELWKAVPDEKRAFMLADLHPKYGSNPWNIGLAGRVLLLTAWHETFGRSFYTSDGTPEGTKVLMTGTDGQVYALAHLGSKLRFFTRHRVRRGDVHGTAFKLAQLKIWESNGTKNGTRVIHEVSIKGGREAFAEPTGLGGILYWLHKSSGQRGNRLWRSDGTSLGTREVFSFELAQVQSMVSAGGRLFLSLRTGKAFQLWTSDGTKLGTRMVREWKFKSPRDSRGRKPIERLVKSCDKMFFVSRTGEKGGLEVWTSDGTAYGTRLILAEKNKQLDIPRPQRIYGPHCVAGNHFLWVEDRLAASGLSTPGKRQLTELLSTDGTQKGTRLVWHWEK